MPSGNLPTDILSLCAESDVPQTEIEVSLSGTPTFLTEPPALKMLLPVAGPLTVVSPKAVTTLLFFGLPF